METERKFQLTNKQAEAFDLLTNSKRVKVLFGGAKGGGKSWLLCVWVYYWAKTLNDLFGLERSRYPIPLGFIGRKRSVDFSKTTLETWKKVIPEANYEIKEGDHEIIVNGKGKIFFGGLDDQDNINKFNSAELAFIAIDQAEETERGDLAVLQASLRLKHKTIEPVYKEFYTANPSECWLKEDFITSPKKNYFYIPALYSDNVYLPADYVQTLESAFSYDQSLLKAYRDGDWSVITSQMTLIPASLFEALKGLEFFPDSVKKIIAADPSRGGDECVVYFIQNGEVIDQLFLHENNPMIVSGHIASLSAKASVDDIAIDSIGNDIGFRLDELGKKVTNVNSAEQAVDKEKFYNKRTEMWWYVMEEIMSKNIPYPKDEELRRQLSGVRYRIVNSNGKVQLEPKSETKKRLSRSPDRADAFVYGIYHLQFVEPEKTKLAKPGSLDHYYCPALDKNREDMQGLGILNF